MRQSVNQMQRSLGATGSPICINTVKASPLLKVNKAEVIDVIVGQYDNGLWYATAPAIPWLAAEGDSQGNVMETIESIAPALRGRLCLDIPFELDWLVMDADK